MLVLLFAAIIIGLIPAVIWLIFFLQEDRKHPEPLPLIISAFLVGALTTVVALFFQILLNNYIFPAGLTSRSIYGVVSFAGIEELLKFLAIFLLISWRRDFDEPIDAMIYMIVAALGFATVENVFLIFKNSDITTIFTSLHVFEITALRFIGANLLHVLASAIIGFHWGIGIARKKFIASNILLGIILATILHSVFNYLIIKTGPTSWAIVLVLFLAFFVLADFEELKALED